MAMLATGRPAVPRGFTLLEVAVAVALLGLGVTVLTEGLVRLTSYLPDLRARQSLALNAASAAALHGVEALHTVGGPGDDPGLWWSWEPGRVVVVRQRGSSGRRLSFTLYSWSGVR